MAALPTRTLLYLDRVGIEPHSSVGLLRVMHVNIIFDRLHVTKDWVNDRCEDRSENVTRDSEGPCVKLHYSC